MIHPHDFGLTAVAFASEFLGTLSGFGSSVFFVPAATLFESLKFVLALTALLHVFGNLSKLALFRSHFRWDLFLRLFFPSVLFTGLGAYLSTNVPLPYLQKCLGVVLLVLPVFFLLGSKHRRISPRLAGLVMAASGFSTGLTGTGGAIRGLALTSLSIEKNLFVSLSASIDIGGDILRAIIYIANGYMDWRQWFYIPLLWAAAVAGSWLGKRALARINQAQFEKIVAFLVMASGASMLFL